MNEKNNGYNFSGKTLAQIRADYALLLDPIVCEICPETFQNIWVLGQNHSSEQFIGQFAEYLFTKSGAALLERKEILEKFDISMGECWSFLLCKDLQLICNVLNENYFQFDFRNEYSGQYKTVSESLNPCSDVKYFKENISYFLTQILQPDYPY